MTMRPGTQVARCTVDALRATAPARPTGGLRLRRGVVRCASRQLRCACAPRTRPTAARSTAACTSSARHRVAVLREGRQHRRVAQRIDEPRDAAGVAVDQRERRRARRSRGRRRRRRRAGGGCRRSCPARVERASGGSAGGRAAAAARARANRACRSARAGPARMMRSTFSLVVSTPESRRTSSSTLLLRFCASSTISSTLRPFAYCSIRKSLSVASSSALCMLERAEAELHQHGLQELDRRDLRLVDLRDDHVLLDFLQEGLDQRGLAGADLAGDHDEAVREPDRRLHVRLGARVDLAQVQERRVRAEPERQFPELEMFEVHASAPTATITGSAPAVRQ